MPAAAVPSAFLFCSAGMMTWRCLLSARLATSLKNLKPHRAVRTRQAPAWRDGRAGRPRSALVRCSWYTFELLFICLFSLLPFLTVEESAETRAGVRHRHRHLVAPCRRRAFTVSMWPLWEASTNAVLPSLLAAASTLAWCVPASAFTMSVWPFEASKACSCCHQPTTRWRRQLRMKHCTRTVWDRDMDASINILTFFSWPVQHMCFQDWKGQAHGDRSCLPSYARTIGHPMYIFLLQYYILKRPGGKGRGKRGRQSPRPGRNSIPLRHSQPVRQ